MSKSATDHPLFEIVTTRMGVISIRNKQVNEIMHNPVGPWAEANALYIDQSGLRDRLDENGAPELVLFDVGLGAAANALAALACARNAGSRPLRIVSFERDLELLRFALAHAHEFDHFRGYEEALQVLLEKRLWTDGPITWELREGDFLSLIEKEPRRPHLVFFDPYSPKVNTEMWTMACFRKLRQRAREPGEGGTLLFTYSRATRVRVALLAAGFFVGYGRATGAKDETTQASTSLEALAHPLDLLWLERWRKSHDRAPFDSTEEDRPRIESLVEDYARKFMR